MARYYLDEILPARGNIIQSSIVSPFSDNDYISVGNVSDATPENRGKSKKRTTKSSNAKNSNVIRNYDTTWNYKVKDGKLFTRRKNSSGDWIDITDNDVARNRIEEFIGQPIRTQSSTKNNTSTTNTSNYNTTQQNNTNITPVGQQSDFGYLTSQFTPKPISQHAGYPTSFSTSSSTSSSAGERKQLLNAEDLAKNKWHWGGVDDISFEGVSNNLYADAVNRAQQQGKILLDQKGRPVTSRQVNRYTWLRDKYTIADRMSEADMALYQPQSENSTLSDVRRAQDFRRNREFDRQRNIGLATMFGLPLAGIGAAEALAAGPVLAGGSYLGADLGGKLTNAAMQKIYGRTWDEISDDPNINFYAQLLNPGRWIGGFAGGYGGAKLQGRMSPVQQYPSGEYEFAGDKIGNVVPKQSTVYNQRPAAMNTMRNMKANAKASTPKKKSVKTTQGQTKKTTKVSSKGPTKKEREKIIKAAYDQAYK